MSFKFSTPVRNAILDAIVAQMGNGALIRIYNGVRPASVATAISGQSLLGTLTCGSPAAPAAAGGQVSFNAITQDASADATGTASWFRIFKADGVTAIIDGDVGTSGSDMNLNTTSIVASGPIQISSCVLTAPGA